MKLPILVAACLALCAGSAAAQVNNASDYLKITSPTGAVLLMVSFPEATIPGVAVPEAAVFNLPPLPDGLVTGALPLTIAPVLGAVVMVEPAGTVPGPGEVVFFFNNRIVSDFVIKFATPNSPLFSVGVAFLSDGDANFLTWAPFLLSLPVPLIPLEETGLPQDMTALLGTPYGVEVLSDVGVVPEPGTIALWLAGLGVVGALTRRRMT